MSVSAELEAARRAEVRREVLTQMARTWDDHYDVETYEATRRR